MKMENKKNELIMLGTGNAAVTRCYNTCFALRTSQGTLLVDAGGGNGILIQLEKAGIAYELIDAQEQAQLSEQFAIMQAPTLVVSG